MTLTALVLAGTRPGGDPLAAAEGVSHKALIDVGGRTMLARVVAALEAVPRVGRIVVATERAELLRGLSRAEFIAAADGPSASVGAALQALGTPLLVTTADHALLRPEWVTAFLAACPPGADVVAALAHRDAVQAAAGPSRRTWLHFTEGPHSGCNLFLLARPPATQVVALWQTLEALRKQPLALVRRLGWPTLLRYAARRLTLVQAGARLGAMAGGADVAQVALVTLQDGRAAIDVDSAGDLALARRLVGSSTADQLHG